MARQRRLELHQLLSELIPGRPLYFQPREGQNLEYPCIVYTMDNSRSDFADGRPYKIQDRYQVSYIDRSPDSNVPRAIAELPLTRFASAYQTDGLNHYNYSVYY